MPSVTKKFNTLKTNTGWTLSNFVGNNSTGTATATTTGNNFTLEDPTVNDTTPGNNSTFSDDMTINVLAASNLQDWLLRYSVEHLTIQDEVLYIGMNQPENLSEIILMDIKGQVLHSFRPHSRVAQINLSEYARGVYYIGAVSNSGSQFVPIQF